jgi:hypothetical protein
MTSVSVDSADDKDTSGAGDIVAEKAAGTQDVASAFPFNPNKAAEYDPDATLAPPERASSGRRGIDRRKERVLIPLLTAARSVLFSSTHSLSSDPTATKLLNAGRRNR